MFSGWSQWNIGIGDSEKMKDIKEQLKKSKKKKKKTKTRGKIRTGIIR